MKFVDRTREIERLHRAIDDATPQFIVIYGRRRVGKSTLIKRALGHRRSIYFQADETQTTNQIYLLSKAVAELIPGFDHVVYPDWYSILESINRQIEPGATLVLDEFPYLVKSFSALASVLQNFWDNSEPRFNLILCGSSQQMMYSEVLNSSSPLYGRPDCIIKLMPLDIKYIAEAMDLKDSREAFAYYSVWGGIPRYWQLCLRAGGGFEESFEELLMQPDATLADEPNRLLRDEIQAITLSNTILSIIGGGANRFSEIAARVGRQASELTGPVKRLIELGYIKKELPFGENSKNAKKTLYKIHDNFLKAYYRFVAPNMSLISMGKGQTLWPKIAADMNSYVGECWEEICRKVVSGGEIAGAHFGEASRWWGSVPDRERRENQEIELDVVAESIDGSTLLVGECKWTAALDAERLLFELSHKVRMIDKFAKYQRVVYVLFLRERPLVAADCLVMLPADVLGLS